MQVLLQIFAGIAQLVEQRIRNAQVVGSSPIPSSRTNRFVKPFGEHGGFSFFRDGLSECAISAPFQKVRLFHRYDGVSAFLCAAFLQERVWKNNCVNANNPEKRTKAKNAAKQGNAGERPDAAARYTVKSSGVNSLLFILHRYLPADKLRELEGGTLEVC